MRILMTTDTVGGVWTYALELAAGLAGQGVEVDLATMGPAPSEAQRVAAGKLSNLRLHVSTFALEWMENPWGDVDRAGEWLLALEASTRPDVVHLNGYAHGDLPFAAPRIVVGHSCVLSWWRAVRGEEAPASWNVYRRRIGAGLRAAELVVAPSFAMLEALQHHYGPLDAAEVIYNGRRAERFQPTTKLPLIFSAGRLWDEAKNLATLDQAARHLPWPVYVAGDVAQPGAGAGAGTSHVTWLGRLSEEELAIRLGFAGIYILPARYEPFGLSILEAALAGCALIVGDIPSLREIWGDTAEYVAPDDAEALVRAAQRLIDDPPRRQRLAARSQCRARAFTTERMAEAYLRRYRELSGAAAPIPSTFPFPTSLATSDTSCGS